MHCRYGRSVEYQPPDGQRRSEPTQPVHQSFRDAEEQCSVNANNDDDKNNDNDVYITLRPATVN